jgi:hypothetical protein
MKMMVGISGLDYGPGGGGYSVCGSKRSGSLVDILARSLVCEMFVACKVGKLRSSLARSLQSEQVHCHGLERREPWIVSDAGKVRSISPSR